MSILGKREKAEAQQRLIDDMQAKIDAANTRADELQQKLNDATHMRCSFCGKKHFEVKKLIAGPSVFICNECIEITLAILIHGAGK